eukprot:2804808-Pyramimonas_sp.AAC.1
MRPALICAAKQSIELLLRKSPSSLSSRMSTDSTANSNEGVYLAMANSMASWTSPGLRCPQT